MRSVFIRQIQYVSRAMKKSAIGLDGKGERGREKEREMEYDGKGEFAERER